MIKLGTAAFNLQVAGLSTEELEEYSSKLFDLWEAQVESELAMLSDYSLRLEVEEGSPQGQGEDLCRGRLGLCRDLWLWLIRSRSPDA